MGLKKSLESSDTVIYYSFEEQRARVCIFTTLWTKNSYTNVQTHSTSFLYSTPTKEAIAPLFTSVDFKLPDTHKKRR